jgi:hypothetical protein
VIDDAGDADVILTLAAPTFTTGSWLAPDNPPMPAINKTTLGNLGAHLRLVLGHSTPPPRVIAVNLSARLREFHAALIVASDGGRRVLLDGEEVPTKEARELAKLAGQIDPLRKQFASNGLTPAESRRLAVLLQREARLRDKAAKLPRGTKTPRGRTRKSAPD